MALTSAEKQRRYRQRREADPLRRAEHKAKCKVKYQQDLTVGKQKHIGDMTTREQRKQRKEWKKRKTDQRKRKTISMFRVPVSQQFLCFCSWCVMSSFGTLCLLSSLKPYMKFVC
jgi:outer membrane cobalamin receptor